ncbi:MAG TPA: DUF1207 domain-containing protein [Longimicrobiales bacterium]|nr:DUF1207 domain-containing protein [Longimicrobiales bacterium]
MSRIPRLLIPLLALGATSAGAQSVQPWCYTGFHPGEVAGTVFLPEGDLFCPLLADPKAERSFVSFLRGDFPALQAGVDVGEDMSIGAVGLGDAFPLVRFGGSTPGDGFQVAIVGSIFAQFDMGTESIDLINADYLVGVPVTVRWSGFSSRLRLYHQSSHLGDEFLLRTELQRENLSFEALELLLSQEFGPLRAYAGGEYLFNREPEMLDQKLAHVGLEARAGQLRGVRFVAAVDAKMVEQRDWDPGLSARAGIEFAYWRDESHPPRLWAILFEFYDGPSPYGQFFQEQVRWFGLGLHLSL